LAVTRNFATWQTLQHQPDAGVEIVIVAIGMTLVIGSGGIDLSVGSLMAIAAALCPALFLNRIVGLPSIYLGVAAAFTLPSCSPPVRSFQRLADHRYRSSRSSPRSCLLSRAGIASPSPISNQVIFTTPEFQFIGLGRLFGIPVQVIIMAIIRGLAAWL